MLSTLRELKDKYAEEFSIDELIESVNNKMDNHNPNYTQTAFFLLTNSGWRAYDIKDKHKVLGKYYAVTSTRPIWFVAECESVTEFITILNKRYKHTKYNTLDCSKEDILKIDPSYTILEDGKLTIDSTKNYLEYILNRDVSKEYEVTLHKLSTVSVFGEIINGVLTPRQALMIACDISVSILIEVIEKLIRLELITGNSLSLNKVYAITGGNTLLHITNFTSRVHGCYIDDHGITPDVVIGWMNNPSFAKYGAPIEVKYNGGYTITLTPVQQLVVLARCSSEQLGHILHRLYLFENKHGVSHYEDELAFAIKAYNKYIHNKILPVNVKIIETIDISRESNIHRFQYEPGKFLLDPESDNPTIE